MDSQILAFEAKIGDNFHPNLSRDSYRASYTMDQGEKKELADLIRRSLEGDNSAMEAIYLEYKRPLFNLAYRYTYDSVAAEDLLQDIFVKVFTHLGDIKRIDTFSGWIYRIALNTCYSFLREKRSKAQKTVPLSEIEEKVEVASYDSNLMGTKQPLDEAINALPPKLKSIFLLHDVQGFKHEEISQMLGCSVGTSKSQLFKARLRIRNFLKIRKMS